nr:MAG TPA: hypothetical protein [Bacteriophage sp.]
MKQKFLLKCKNSVVTYEPTQSHFKWLLYNPLDQQWRKP